MSLEYNPETRQVGGTHYFSSYQHWDLVHRVGMCYFSGSATAYVCRWRRIDGKVVGKGGIEDLRKALSYVNKLEDIASEIRVLPKAYDFTVREVGQFCAANQLTPLEAAFVAKLATWADRYELAEARQLLFQLMDEAEKVDPRLEPKPAPLTEENHHAERDSMGW